MVTRMKSSTITLMSSPKISERNTRVFAWAEFGRSLVFIIPVWIMLLRERIGVEGVAIYLAVGFVTQLILELPTGALADLIGRKKTVILAYIVDAVQYIGMAFATTLPQFILLSIVSGTAEALRSGSLEAIVYDSLKQDKREGDYKKVMSAQGIRFQLGLMISTALGGFMGSYWEPLPYIATGLLLFISAGVAIGFVEPVIDSEKFGLRNYLRQIKWGVIEAFKTKDHREISLYYIVVGGISWMCATYFNDSMLIDLGFAAEQRGVIAAGLRLVNILLLYKVLTNEKIFNFRRTILFFPILMSFALLPGWWLSGYWGVPFVGMAMMSSTARWIILGEYTNAAYSSKYRATAISTLSMAIGLIYAIGVLGAGWVMQRYGDTRLIYTMLGMLTLLTVPYLGYRLLKTHE
jgi:MFS family permease